MHPTYLLNLMLHHPWNLFLIFCRWCAVQPQSFLAVQVNAFGSICTLRVHWVPSYKLAGMLFTFFTQCLINKTNTCNTTRQLDNWRLQFKFKSSRFVFSFLSAIHFIYSLQYKELLMQVKDLFLLFLNITQTYSLMVLIVIVVYDQQYWQPLFVSYNPMRDVPWGGMTLKHYKPPLHSDAVWREAKYDPKSGLTHPCQFSLVQKETGWKWTLNICLQLNQFAYKCITIKPMYFSATSVFCVSKCKM